MTERRLVRLRLSLLKGQREGLYEQPTLGGSNVILLRNRCYEANTGLLMMQYKKLALIKYQ